VRIIFASKSTLDSLFPANRATNKKMAKLVVSIPELGLSPTADDARQLYVLAFACDLNIKENKETEIIGAGNKNIAALVPDLASKDAMNFLLASVSNIFSVSRSFPRASLSGSGIMIYPNLDPKGFFALQLFVIESDDNHRRFGEKLKKVLNNKKVKGTVEKLKETVSNPLVGSLMGAVAETVPAFFSGSGDDLLLSHAHSGFDFDNYGIPGEQRVAEFSFINKIVAGKLRIRISG
jgi:hypothetical protein